VRTLAFDSWSEFYRSDFSPGAHVRNLAEHGALFDEVLSGDPGRVLEVGVGTGTMSLFVASLGVRVTAIDNDDEVLRAARARASAVSGLEYRLADAFTLVDTFERDEFDIAFSQGFFEHFADSDVRHLAAQQLAVARRVVFSVPSDEYPQQDFGNERLLSPARWAGMLEGVGAVRACYYGRRLLRRARHLGLGLSLPGYRRLHVLVVIDRPPLA
jgi:SAM-dependent methyltransferase